MERDNTNWETASIALPGALDGASSVIFRVYFGTDNVSEVDYGVAFDDFLITGTEATAASPFVGKVTINNTSTGVTLNDPLTVTGLTTFTSGVFITDATNIITFDTGATVAGASDDSHVNGYMNKNTTSATKFTFPSGDGTALRAFAITPSSTTYTTKYFNTAHADTDVDGSGLDHISTQEYWDFARTGASPEDAIIETTWHASSGVSDYTTLELAHYDGTTDWDMVAATPVGTNPSGTITSDAAVSSFGPFTIGTTSSVNALPIQLTTFTGVKEEENNKLNWTTSSEQNNDYFTVEKSTDGLSFETVGIQNGAGSSNQYLYYSLMDYSVRPVLNYYRLKQTDFDGESTFSELISIDNRASKGVNAQKEVSYKTNIMGQEVNEFYRGIVVIVYSDGSSVKVIQ
jgi:hypothetical protein